VLLTLAFRIHILGSAKTIVRARRLLALAFSLVISLSVAQEQQLQVGQKIKFHFAIPVQMEPSIYNSSIHTVIFINGHPYSQMRANEDLGSFACALGGYGSIVQKSNPFFPIKAEFTVLGLSPSFGLELGEFQGAQKIVKATLRCYYGRFISNTQNNIVSALGSRNVTIEPNTDRRLVPSPQQTLQGAPRVGSNP